MRLKEINVGPVLRQDHENVESRASRVGKGGRSEHSVNIQAINHLQN